MYSKTLLLRVNSWFQRLNRLTKKAAFFYIIESTQDYISKMIAAKDGYGAILCENCERIPESPCINPPLYPRKKSSFFYIRKTSCFSIKKAELSLYQANKKDFLLPHC
jgi:hypothetical protein